MRSSMVLPSLAASALLQLVSAGPVTQDDCAARTAAIVVHGDARFTVLTERVVRLEKAPFVDDCTFTIVKRNVSLPAFTHTVSGDQLTITTAQLTLTHDLSAIPAPAPACGATADVLQNVAQQQGKRSEKYPGGLQVADAGACCTVCATDTTCSAWIFREKNESGSSKSLNCWPMTTVGSIFKPHDKRDARTIGVRNTTREGFLPDEVTIKLKGGSTWRPGMDGSAANLGGTISSWNEVSPRALLSGNDTYQPGILSKDGWAIVDDTRTPRFSYAQPLWQGSLPWYAPPLDGANRADLYMFACGTDFQACLADFTLLSGPVPIPPLATMGIWWSHYETYDQETIQSHVLEKFLQYEMPLNVLQMDCGWHLNNSHHNPHCQGYNGYDWNEALFPTPKQFVSELKAGSLSGGRPLKLLLNTHNFLGLDECQAEFPALESRLPPLQNASGPILYNTTDLETMTGIFDLALGRNATGTKAHDTRPDYWWHDGSLGRWGEDTGVSPTAGANSGNLFFSVYAHDSHIRTASAWTNRPMVMPRFGWLGQHRYCCGFSGDQTSEWETLEAEVTMTATAANVAFAHWRYVFEWHTSKAGSVVVCSCNVSCVCRRWLHSHDIGGFRGDPTPELYLRWTQFGALSPMYRSHGTKGSMRDYWDPSYAAVFPLMRQSLALRLALVPYIYTAARQAHETGVAAVHSLYLDWPGEQEAYSQPLSFMHGRDVLVRPVVAEISGTDAKIDVWLPPSETGWIAWNDGLFHDAANVVRASAALNQLPMYIRGGAVIPLLPMGTLDATAATRGDAINWGVFLGAVGTEIAKTGNTSRYFDDGDSTLYEGASGKFATQTFSYTISTDHEIRATIAPAVSTGGFVLPSAKVLHSIEFRGRHAPSVATMGGAAMSCTLSQEHSVTRPAGTVICEGPTRYGLAQSIDVVLRFD